jgi:putative phosphoesterase
MARAFVVADIHGIYSVWQNIKEHLSDGDILIVAGDLFGTRYPSRDNPDYQPEKIREEYMRLSNEKYYIYGNCDTPDFFPGQEYEKNIKFNGLKILLIHGDTEFKDSDFDMLIFGHTHVPFLKKEGKKIHLNPGSPSKPRGFTGGFLLSTYALIEDNKIKIINYKNGKIVKELNLI